MCKTGGELDHDGPDGKRVREAIGVCGGVARDQSKCGRGTVTPFNNNGYVLCTYRSRGKLKMKRREIRSQDVSPRFRSDNVRRHR